MRSVEYRRSSFGTPDLRRLLKYSRQRACIAPPALVRRRGLRAIYIQREREVRENVLDCAALLPVPSDRRVLQRLCARPFPCAPLRRRQRRHAAEQALVGTANQPEFAVPIDPEDCAVASRAF